MTATGQLWGYHVPTAYWYPIGSINGGAALAEVTTDKLAHVELVTGLRKFSRLYFRILTLGGTATEIEVWADCVRAGSVVVG
jgi:hypothetical protein